MFFIHDTKIPDLELAIGREIDIREFIDHSWKIEAVSHIFLKKIIPTIEIHRNILTRFILKNPLSVLSVYLAFYLEIYNEITDINNFNPYYAMFIWEYSEYFTDQKKLEKYLENCEESDTLFLCLNGIFKYKENYLLTKSAPLLISFNSRIKQKKAVRSLILTITKLLEEKYLNSESIHKIDPWIVNNFNITSIHVSLRSRLNLVESLKNNFKFSYQINNFISSIEYIWKIYEDDFSEDFLRLDEYLLAYDKEHDSFKLSDNENNEIIIGEYSHIYQGYFESIPEIFQRFIFKKKRHLNILFPSECLNSYKKHIFIDKSNKYIFKKSPKDTSYFENIEIIIDYLISRVLEGSLYAKNFVTSMAIYQNWKIQDSTIIPTEGNGLPYFYIMEYLPGETLYSLLKTHEFDGIGIISILLEVFVALQNAYELFRFTHYDLHPGNIILKKCEDYVWSWNEYTLDIKRGYRPVIIDFGRARLEINGHVISRPWTPVTKDFLCINPEISYPAHDIFKILITCYEYTDLPVLHDIIVHIFGGNYGEWCYSYGEAMFSLPYLEKFKDIEYKNIINYLFERYK